MVENVIQIKKLDNDKCRRECKNSTEHHVCKRNYIWNLAKCKNGKYLGSTIGGSVITCREVIGVTKTIPTNTISTNFNKKR